MKPLTQEDTDTFLQAIRDGLDRGEAAETIGRKGTQLRRMMNPDTTTYNHDLHVAYLQAISERGQGFHRPGHRPPSHAQTTPTNSHGFTKAHYLTDTDLNTYLDDIAAGTPRDLAARKINTSLVQINRRCNNDPDFARRYSQALDEGYPHYQDWLRAKAVDFIENGNYNALRDQIMVHLPEAEKLRTSKHEIGGVGGGPIKVLQAVLPDLPPELLDEMIKHVKELESRKDAIEPGP